MEDGKGFLSGFLGPGFRSICSYFNKKLQPLFEVMTLRRQTFKYKDFWSDCK